MTCIFSSNRILSNRNLLNHNFLNREWLMFIGRKDELKFLKSKYEKSNGQLVVIYGRRRIGKTELLREFFKDIPHLIHLWHSHSNGILEWLNQNTFLLLKKDDLKLSFCKSFGLVDKDISSVSRIIKDAIDAKMVKANDPNTAPRYLKYVPYWAWILTCW